MDAVDRYVDSLVEGLVAGGAKNAVVCPGSRSTPLVLAFARRRKGVRSWVLYDERSAGFFALGMAESSSSPVVLVSTSGSAAANFLPAVVEASYSRVPLVVVTADRPPELRDFGGAQTIDQVRLYGSHVKWFQDMPMAAELASLFRYSEAVGARAASIASAAPAGPVHLNFPFREPLLTRSSMGSFRPEMTRGVSVGKVTARATKDSITRALTGVKSGSRGLIIVGPGDFRHLKGGLAQLSETLGWPILADALSNLRQGESIPGLVAAYEFLVRNKAFREANVPEWVIRVGGVPTSKELNIFCDCAAAIILDEGDGWRDPDFRATRVIPGDVKSSLLMMGNAVRGFKAPKGWLSTWQREGRDARKRVDELMRSIGEPFEGKLFHRLSRLLDPSRTLSVVVGSSMPVRDLDYFFHGGSDKVRLRSNRGANGIDGVVSTAMGVAAAEGNVLLVIGDVSFYHDMNGVLASSLYGLRATVVVVNNRGGGIFSFLPQHSLPSQVFEEFFGESHDLDLSGVRTIYGGKFTRVSSWEAFDRALSSSVEGKGLKIIELEAPSRETNVALHRRAFEAVSSGVRA